MEQKYFNVKNPNEQVTIINEQSNFYQLSSGTMIKKDSFNEKYQPVLAGFENETVNDVPIFTPTNNDVVDPNAFFSTKINLDTTEINKLKNVDTSKIVDQVERTQVVNDTSKGIQQIQQQPTTQLAQQNINQQAEISNINRMFDDEKMVYGENEATLRRNKRLQKLLPPSQQVQSPQQPVHNDIKIPSVQQPKQDPMQMMISTFKKVHEITFNIEFKDKIASPEFIKLMMQNMDGDIISYYKDMVMNNITTNIKMIEDIVEKTLKDEIGIDDVDETITIKPKKTTKLVVGKLNKSGKQLYKYINDKGKIVELLKTTAEKKGFKPFEK